MATITHRRIAQSRRYLDSSASEALQPSNSDHQRNDRRWWREIDQTLVDLLHHRGSLIPPRFGTSPVSSKPRSAEDVTQARPDTRG
ncbi:hypothetical protein PAPYR_5506 [Paratrimastix pyriformis]|uniref:Uncharacterized protein n=1 Tax=Paratrimastix pyriformis TaxID=342808 RepID=A0ABQ8UHM8_9EUKA|nr:hypothetical protein PAPYR_5506 [Paratrimastix pyriformis]